MGKIIKLNEKISNMIAAGEVVERPLSVVKELVENSIDAKSSYIEIELEESGIKLIRVTDDGEGMNKDDALLAFSRHATSKIKNEHDLFRISSLGFRGEALPSIASVAKVSLITSTGDEGYSVNISGGNPMNHGLAVARKGTEINVRNLFYNTPARLKFLKSLNTELSYITDYVTKVALSHSNIAIMLSNNGKKLISTDGSGQILKAISSVYGVDVAKSMTCFECKNYDYEVTGYTSKPTLTRSNKNYINIIINDRVIKNFVISNELINAYGNRIPKGRYPITVINIKCDPLLIDVNVHPNKMQVKMTDERKLVVLIKAKIQEVLSEQISIPSINPKEPIYDIINDDNSVQEQLSLNYISENSTLKLFPNLEYIGQFHGTYLLCQCEDGLYILDQHAAAERIKYEDYIQKLTNKNNESYELLVPINLEFSTSDANEIRSILNNLEEYGISLTDSGLNSFYLREVPTWFKNGLEREYTDEFINSLLEDRENVIIDSLASQLACKKSIKANEFLDRREVETLITNLSTCENPFTCPHGRPTLIKYSIREIERYFRR
ncbi:DNA mismatch repair endonuclease MutL [Mycoplasmatota bacterium]|nr:DNA mismatch repair endonuclease MutL [Mycoplasmatota bacterium]